MKTILIIEDEKLLADLLYKKLTALNYRVYVAEDGEAGYGAIQEIKPDLVLLDMMLPKKEGMEVLEDIRSNPSIASTPVIVISNSGQPVEVERAKELGAVDWLVKANFDPQEVIDKVQQYIS